MVCSNYGESGVADGNRDFPPAWCPRGGTVTGFTEDELLATIRRLLSGEAPAVREGPGDDAAVADMGWQTAVLTADMLVEGVQLDRSTISARDLEYKASVVKVRDVERMGGGPGSDRIC